MGERSSCLSHGFSFEVELAGVVDEPVEDGVGPGSGPGMARALAEYFTTTANPMPPNSASTCRVSTVVRAEQEPTYATLRGFSTDRVIINTFRGTPMRHRGEQVGNFFLGEKETGLEFTDEDEEVLVLFAARAATVIVNARPYRDERRARGRP